MKNILFVASDMEIGGAERALLGLLDSIDTEKYNVDLFLLRHRGPFMNLISEKVNLLPESNIYSDIGVPINEVIVKRHWRMAAARARGKWKAKKFISQNNLPRLNSVEIHYSFLYTKKLLPFISEKEYDLAIAFTAPYYIVGEKVRAKKKVVWLHTDYSCVDGDTEEEFNVWAVYDHIISISNDVTKGFLTKFEALSDRIIQIENIVSPSIIRKQAEAFSTETEMPVKKGVTNILSIGRFCEAKNFDSVPEICSNLLNYGCNVRWYLIGFGGDLELIRQKIKEYNMEKFVIILGKKDNPYPYIKACNLYVQPSRFEGKAVTVREAQILAKPVVITNYPTANSQLQNGTDGIIVSMDSVGCAKGISELLHHPEKVQNLIDRTKNIDYFNMCEVRKLYDLMEE